MTGTMAHARRYLSLLGLLAAPGCLGWPGGSESLVTLRAKNRKTETKCTLERDQQACAWTVAYYHRAFAESVAACEKRSFHACREAAQYMSNAGYDHTLPRGTMPARDDAKAAHLYALACELGGKPYYMVGGYCQRAAALIADGAFGQPDLELARPLYERACRFYQEPVARCMARTYEVRARETPEQTEERIAREEARVAKEIEEYRLDGKEMRREHAVRLERRAAANRALLSAAISGVAGAVQGAAGAGVARGTGLGGAGAALVRTRRPLVVLSPQRQQQLASYRARLQGSRSQRGVLAAAKPGPADRPGRWRSEPNDRQALPGQPPVATPAARPSAAACRWRDECVEITKEVRPFYDRADGIQVQFRNRCTEPIAATVCIGKSGGAPPSCGGFHLRAGADSAFFAYGSCGRYAYAATGESGPPDCVGLKAQRAKVVTCP